MKERRAQPTAHTRLVKNPHTYAPETVQKPDPIDWAHFDPPKRRDEDALREMLGIPTE